MPVDMKQVIAEAFAELLAHKKVEKITVKELVEACHISRQTFYYHFQDTMEVVEYLMDQRLQRSLAASLEAESPQEAIRELLSTTAEEKRLVKHLLSSQRKEEMIQLLVRISQTYFEKMLRTKADAPVLSGPDMETAIRFYSYGVIGLLLYNLESGQDPDVLADQIVRLLSGEMLRGPSPSL